MKPNAEDRYQQLRQEILLALAVLTVITSIGTLGYRLIEGWSWIDSAYMTIITMSTVGFTEVEPLSPGGRLFTIGLIFLGVVSIGYIINHFTEAVLQGSFQEGIRLRQQRLLLSTLNKHYIICGFGRTGRNIALEFAAEGIEFIVIDFSPEMIAQAKQLNYTAIMGDVTLDEVLQQAGIDRAVCIVAALASDAENLYTVLSAKSLNPQIRTIARANTEEAVQKLQRGGADAVVSPHVTGGRRMAAAALRPQVMDFVDGILTGTDRSFYMEEFLLDASSSPCVGQSLREARLRSRSGALVLAIRRTDGNLIAGPMAEARIEAGDTLICMGTAEQLRSLNQILSPLKVRTTLRLPKH